VPRRHASCRLCSNRALGNCGCYLLWLDTLDLSGMDQGWGAAQAAKSVDGNPLSIGGYVFQHGVGTHAYSEMTVRLHGQAAQFRALVGVDDEVQDLGSVVFVIYVDDEEVKRTEVLRGADSAEMILVDLHDAEEFTILVEDGGDNLNYDHADLAAAMIVLTEDATTLPETAFTVAGPEIEIARGVAPEPAIHAPRITGATPGHDFLFRVPATGEGPLQFHSEGLPPGLELDEDTGIITGALATEGTWDVTITVTGVRGTAESNLTILGGEHSLALTPPMGWNSWNVWGTSVDDEKIMQAADWMDRSGLAAHGYQYINIDDAWEGERAEDGTMQTNEKFPDMKALADYVHSKGLKLGIYSSPGPKTCAGYEGSYQHEFQDAKTFAEWGIDLIKYDLCSYRDIIPDYNVEELRKPYDLMREALDACGRDIVYSLCEYGLGQVSEWGADVGGNYWRTTGDIVDTWVSMSTIGFGQAGLEECADPGHWNDPDMLVVGQVGWGPELHPTRLTRNEQVTHITLWSLLASPLLIGCDLTQLDAFTLALLTNPEVLEVSQDPLGRQASRIKAQQRLEVWARPLADGSTAVGLFNRSRKEREIAVFFSDLGLEGPQRVRDLWLRRDEGVFDDGFTADVPGHGAFMLKIQSVQDR
jgi:alpha-galactosidase